MPGAAAGLVAVLGLLLMLAAGCSLRNRSDEPHTGGFTERGIASWYGPGFHGNRTANGEVYDQMAMTAAHKELPFDTVVEVHNLDNGAKVRVRINDRGPFIRGRIIDLSRAAAEKIHMIGPGTARVRIRAIGGPPPDRAASDRRSGVYRVQAGAFRDIARAEAQARALENDYPSAEVRSSGGWHRVILGPFGSRGRARDVVRELRRRGVEALVL